MEDDMKTFALAAAAIGLACTTTPAFAGSGEKATMTIKLDDIDLASPKGQEVLDRRIEQTARTVCRVTEVRTGTRIMDHSARACIAKARAEARQQVAALVAETGKRGG
jgi:UrcA family protein